MKFHKLAFAAALLAVSAFTGNTGFALAEDVEVKAEEEAAPIEYTPPEGAENFQFEAEVHRMLDIVVNSLYQNKDVFLRELISNASDALDKIRFLGLTNASLMQDKEDLEVRIEFDKDAKTLTIRDSGVGMTHTDLVGNLGTVARSGTTKFLEALAEKDKNDDVGGMIGKFGVGFYSTFLVADRVSVASKHPESDKQYVWESVNGESSYHIYEDPRGVTLGRGTEITLHLKDDALEYADESKLRELVGHYSEFITHPIFLRTVTTTTVEIDEDEDEEEPKDEDDDVEVSEEEDAESESDEKPKKTEEVTTYDWEELNTNVPIWTRDKDSIEDEEYQSFWNVVSKEDHTKAARWNHFNAEGNINFKSILYLPEEIPDHYKFGNIDAVKGGLKLYVRKVLISDEFDLMPRYLGFIRGVVDSDDLPLNVNRETLQESKIIKVIKKKLVRKALDMIRSFAKETGKGDEEESKDVEIDEEGNVVEEVEEDSEGPYIEWYRKFSNNLKMGILDDEANRGKIAKLLRFQTSKSVDDDKWVSLEQYVENMQEWQKDIYVMAGASVDEIKKSPFLEKFTEKDVEVIFLTDPVDEYMTQQLRDFDGNKFQSITAENVKLQDEDEDLVKRREKAYKKKFKPLTKWLKKLYGPAVMRVAISKRLGSAPAIVSNSEYGHSANMERIMRAQAYQHGQDDFSMRAMRILEINPRHPFITKLLEGAPPEKEEEGEDPFVVSEETEDAAWMLLDMASLGGGFPVTDGAAHSKRMNKYMQATLGVEGTGLEDEIDPPEDDDDDEDDAPEIDMDMGMGMDGLNMADFDMDSLDLD